MRRTDRAIARSLGIARSTVAATLDRLAAAELCWPLPATLSDRVLEAMLYAGPGTQRVSRRKAEPDWTHVHRAANSASRRRISGRIREGVEAIAEYLQLHAGLHFSLGLVELPIYVMPNGDRLVAPRVLARTALLTRNVVAVPDGYSVDEVEDPTTVAEIDPERAALGDQSRRFSKEFLDNYLKLDDPEQPKPNPARLG